MNTAWERTVSAAAILAVALALAVYAWLLWSHSLNIPYRDDILDVLRFLIQVDQFHDPRQLASALWVQHNDHRTAASRLVYLLLRWVNGEIDFRLLGLIINLASLGFFLLFASALRRDHPARGLFCVPLALLLFQPLAFALITYPMAMAAMYGVFLYAMLSFFLLRASGWLSLALAMLCAALATFSQASGQLVWLVGVAALLQCRWQQPGYTLQLLAWLAGAALTLVAFHTGFHSPNDPWRLLELMLQTPLRHAWYFLALLGSSVSLGNLEAARLAGAVFLLALLWLSFRERAYRSQPVFFTAWFCVLSCVAMALGRAPYTSAEAAIGSRFSVPSQLLVCALWVVWANRLEGYRIPAALVATLASLALCAGSYHLYTPRLEELSQARLNQYRAGNWFVVGMDPQTSKGIVAQAISRGIYVPPRTGNTKTR